MYYMERNGKINFEDINITLRQLQAFFRDIYRYFDDKGYFTLAFEGNKYQPCLMVPGPNAYFFKHTGSNKIYPIYEHYYRYNKDTLFTVIEILHEYVRRVEDYDVIFKEEVQKEFRDEINKFLRFFEDGYELNVKGWIAKSSNTALKDLIYKDLPTDTQDEVTLQVETAIRMFFHYTTNNEQRKKAINILADILEPLREDIKNYTLKEHDKMIFGIVNTCKIRHNNEKQCDEYNKDVWYEWMFHYYLSTIHAILRLKE